MTLQAGKIFLFVNICILERSFLILNCLQKVELDIYIKSFLARYRPLSLTKNQFVVQAAE